MTLSSTAAGASMAVALVRLDDLVVEDVTEAGRVLLGRPLDQVVGRPVFELLDADDHGAARSALDGLRRGSIDFFRAYGHGPTSPRVRVGFVAWVRAVELGGTRYALATWVDRRPSGRPRPTPENLAGRFAAVAVADREGVVRAAFVDPEVPSGLAADDLVGGPLVPDLELDALVAAAADASVPPDGIAVGFPVSIITRDGRPLELRAIVAGLAASSDRLVGLISPPPPGPREVELEAHLWRIAAEVEASGILLRAGTVPRLPLARIATAPALTPRQWEILRRLMAGQRVPTIARELFIAQSTVRNHLAAIFDRFGVHSQPELLALLSEPHASSTGSDAPSMA